MRERLRNAHVLDKLKWFLFEPGHTPPTGYDWARLDRTSVYFPIPNNWLQYTNEPTRGRSLSSYYLVKEQLDLQSGWDPTAIDSRRKLQSRDKSHFRTGLAVGIQKKVFERLGRTAVQEAERLIVETIPENQPKNSPYSSQSDTSKEQNGVKLIGQSEFTSRFFQSAENSLFEELGNCQPVEQRDVDANRARGQFFSSEELNRLFSTGGGLTDRRRIMREQEMKSRKQVTEIIDGDLVRFRRILQLGPVQLSILATNRTIPLFFATGSQATLSVESVSNRKTDTLYIILFGSLSDEWPHNEPIARTMIEKSILDRKI